jgi:hypothetical protein
MRRKKQPPEQAFEADEEFMTALMNCKLTVTIKWRGQEWMKGLDEVLASIVPHQAMHIVNHLKARLDADLAKRHN